VNKITTREDVERLKDGRAEKLEVSNIPRLSAEELFRLAAQLDVRSGDNEVVDSPGTIFHPYIE
jgi:hypothetical protein